MFIPRIWWHAFAVSLAICGLLGSQAMADTGETLGSIGIAPISVFATTSVSPAGGAALCLANVSGGVSLAACDKSAAQSWIYDGQQLRNPDNACVSVNNPQAGAKLTTAACDSGNKGQLFTFVAIDGGKQLYKLAGSNLCIDVTGGAFSAGTALQLYDCDKTNANQAFTSAYTSPKDFGCTVKVVAQQSWQDSQDGTSHTVINLFLQNTSPTALMAPYTVEMVNSAYTAVYQTWNWAPYALNNGMIKGSESRSWASLQGAAANSVNIGMEVGVSGNVSAVPEIIVVNGTSCNITTGN